MHAEKQIGKKVDVLRGPLQTIIIAKNMAPFGVTTVGLSPEEAKQRVNLRVAEYERARARLAAEYGETD